MVLHLPHQELHHVVQQLKLSFVGLHSSFLPQTALLGSPLLSQPRIAWIALVLNLSHLCLNGIDLLLTPLLILFESHALAARLWEAGLRRRSHLILLFVLGSTGRRVVRPVRQVRGLVVALLWLSLYRRVHHLGARH